MKLILCFTAIILGLTLLTLKADDLPPAPKEYIDSAIIDCKEYALEDAIDQAKMKEYLLECVNGELEGQGFNKLDKLEL